MLTLSTTKRDPKISRNQLQAEGKVPGVIYGPKTESIPVAFNAPELLKVWKDAGESTIITVNIDGEDHDVLIHDIQLEPVLNTIMHIDLYAIERGKKITVSVPIVFVGESAGEKAGGVLNKTLHEIEIESMPRNLPKNIEVDLSALTEVGSKIDVGDLTAPEGVEFINEDDDTIASISEAKEEVEREDAPSIEDIEVEGEKKEEGESIEE